jgi:hypothetical protein
MKPYYAMKNKKISLVFARKTRTYSKSQAKSQANLAKPVRKVKLEGGWDLEVRWCLGIKLAGNCAFLAMRRIPI